MTDGKWSQPLMTRFPINRRHQGLATPFPRKVGRSKFPTSFQSIGVTKDWRPTGPARSGSLPARFQSIGVTKDWRPGQIWRAQLLPGSFQSIGVTKDWRLGEKTWNRPDLDQFPINRRHQGLATLFAICIRRAVLAVSNQ